MNFYKRFIGDIQAKTGDLTLAEFGAYDRLLDHYYSTEQPLPHDVAKCYRICRAMNPQERAAVDAVLSQFFELIDGGYVQSKADEVIAKAQPLIEAARANGKKGGRPKKDPEQKPVGFSEETREEPGAKATQSQSQPSPSGEGEVKARKRAADPAIPRPDGVEEGTWDDWLQLRKALKAPVTGTVIAVARREADKAGIPLQRFLEIWCMRGIRGLQADWIRADERGTAARPPQHQTPSDRRAETIAGLTNPGARHAARHDGTIDVEAHIVG